MGQDISKVSEVNYRDFHIVEKKMKIDVQVNSDSEFLARRIFNEVNYKPVGFWEAMRRLGISILNLFLQSRIEYEVSTR